MAPFTLRPKLIDRAKHLRKNMTSAEKKLRKDFLQRSKWIFRSPTILVDGTELERKPGNYFYGCCIYFIYGKATGTPGRNYIREKLAPCLK